MNPVFNNSPIQSASGIVAHENRASTINPGLLWAICVISLGTFISASLFASPAAATAAKPKTEAPLSMTNTPSLSVFHEVETRDPFWPIGYKKPPPKIEGATVKSKVKPKLVVTGISVSPDGTSATLQNGEVIEPGGTYKYKTEDGTIVEYKVLSITETTVIILYEGEEIQYPMKSGELDKFIEKE